MDQLADLSLACLGTPSELQGDRLQEFNDLLIVAPEDAFVDGVKAIAPEKLAEWLASGAHDTAALAFLDDASYMISRGRGGYMATVMIPDSDECTATADTFALALLSALAEILLDAAKTPAPSCYLPDYCTQPRQLH